MEDCAQHLGHCMVDMRELSATPEGLTAAGERADRAEPLNVALITFSFFSLLILLTAQCGVSPHLLSSHLFCVRVSESVCLGELGLAGREVQWREGRTFGGAGEAAA